MQPQLYLCYCTWLAALSCLSRDKRIVVFCCCCCRCCLLLPSWFIHPAIHQSVNLLVTHISSQGIPIYPSWAELRQLHFPLVVYKTWALFAVYLLFLFSLRSSLFSLLLRQHAFPKGQGTPHSSTAVTLLLPAPLPLLLRFMGLQMRQKLQLQLLTQNRKRIPSSVQYLLKIITETTSSRGTRSAEE